MRFKLISTSFAAFALAICSNTRADSIHIENPSFETPATGSVEKPVYGWDNHGNPAAVWNINNDPQGSWYMGAPEGDQVAALTDLLSQSLGDVVATNTVYTLGGWVGNQLGQSADYSVALYAAGNLLAAITGTGRQGYLDPFQLTFNSTGSTFVGLQLEVQLNGGQPGSAFDMITLNAESAPTAPAHMPVPPAALGGGALMGGCGFVAIIRRRHRSLSID